MKKFTCVQDIGDLKIALAEAFEIKKDGCIGMKDEYVKIQEKLKKRLSEKRYAHTNR